MADRDLVRKDRLHSNAPSPRGKNYLLAIAINDYQHCTKLNNAVLDVEAFIELMTSRYNFEKDNITLIKDTEATKRRIDRAFDRLIDTVSDQDNLIVYFSGHGRHHERRGGFWVPVEAGTSDEDWPDYLSNDHIKSYLARIKSFHTFLIADSCFSGSLFIDKSKEKFSGDRRDTEPSRWGLTSGKKEIVSDGQPGQHSPFAAALLDVLRKAEQPPGVMRVCDLVLEKVAANAQQTPMGSPLLVTGHQGGQMVFYFREDEELEWAAALAANTRKAYSAFYNKYSKGNYGKLALEKLSLVEEKEIWDKVPRSRESALLLYIHENPYSPYLEEAQQLVEKLQKVASIVESPYVKPSPVRPGLIIPEHMVLVEGGTFEMGDVLGDKEYSNETVHTVTVSDFLLAKFQLTKEEYDVFCTHIGRKLPDDWGIEGRRRPITNVSWYDAIQYCNWRSDLENLDKVYVLHSDSITPDWTKNGYRLPTEAEWEYAAREKGRRIRFGNGKSIADPHEINFDGSKSFQKEYSVVGYNRGKTVEVGLLKPSNNLNLYDMSGNVWEWCWDWYGEYSQEVQINPKGPDEGLFHVYRGGSWDVSANWVRASFRPDRQPAKNYFNIGFRLARTATNV